MKKVRKAVIPAAGYGTRFLPATKALPKEMLPLVDTPTIQYIVEEAIESGIEEIIIIVSANKNAIIDHFDRNLELEAILKEKKKDAILDKVTNNSKGINIHYVRQQEQLGLGHAVLHAKTFIGDEPFALLLGDDVYVGEKEPALKELIDTHKKTNSSVIGVLNVSDEDVSKYGIVSPKTEIKDTYVELKDVVEKPNLEDAPSNLAIGGRYLLTPTIFEFLENQEKGAGNEIQLTDSIKRLMSKETVFAKQLNAKRYDIGSRIGFIEATIDFALQRDDLRDQVIDLFANKIIK